MKIDVVEDGLRVQLGGFGGVDERIGTQRETQFVTDDSITKCTDRESIHGKKNSARGFTHGDGKLAVGQTVDV